MIGFVRAVEDRLERERLAFGYSVSVGDWFALGAERMADIGEADVQTIARLVHK